MLCAILIASAFGLVPLNDLGPAPYKVIPADHLAAGLQRAALITPRDADGRPSPSGKIVFLSVGFGETARITDSFLKPRSE